MKKISLKGISEILSEKELKNVMGGSGGSGGGSCKGADETCSSSCPDKFVWNSDTMTGYYVKQTCKKEHIGTSGLWFCWCI